MLMDKADMFPNLHSVTASKSRSNFVQFGQTLVGCLTSSKSETRSIAESLLRACVSNEVFKASSLSNFASKMRPAEQRKVQPIMESLGSLANENPSTRPRSSTPNGGRPSGRQTPSSRQSLSGRQTPSGRQSVSGRRTPSASRSQRTGTASSSRPRSVSRNGRQPHDVDVEQLISDRNFNPLKPSHVISISKRQRLMKQRDHIPEYPEEPLHIDVFKALKKTWSSLIPSETMQVLFPTNGILKQDDAIDGCTLLTRAVSLSAENGEQNIILEQVDLIIRWISIALCSRNQTSGLEPLLHFLHEFISFLHNESYQRLDSESAMLLPYIIERAGSAKVSVIIYLFYDVVIMHRVNNFFRKIRGSFVTK